MSVVSLYRYCFFRLWQKCSGHDPEGSKHTAVGLLSGLAVLNCCTLLVAAEIILGRSILPLYPYGALNGLVLYIAFDVAHYIWLARGRELGQVGSEVDGDRPELLEIGYRLYLVGSPLIFFALMGLVLALDLYD